MALAVCALAYITILNFDLPKSIDLLIFTFFATVTGYNFVKYFGIAKFHHRSLAPDLRYIQIFSLLCFIGLVYYTLKLPAKTLWYLGGLAAITFFYAIPFLPKSLFFEGKKNLRAISGLKIYVIAFVWAVTTVIIPIVNANEPVSHDALVFAFQILIYVLVAMLPFEIRDIQYDSLKLATIPQRIGLKKTKLFGIFLLLVFFMLEFLKDHLRIENVIIIGIITIITFGFLMRSRVNQSEYYSSFFIEAIPILWLGLILLIN